MIWADTCNMSACIACYEMRNVCMFQRLLLIQAIPHLSLSPTGAFIAWAAEVRLYCALSLCVHITKLLIDVGNPNAYDAK